MSTLMFSHNRDCDNKLWFGEIPLNGFERFVFVDDTMQPPLFDSYDDFINHDWFFYVKILIMNGNENFLTLGIETSCDDTGVAILRNEREVLCEYLSSQIKDHSRFGGVIPEFAARKHLENLLPLVDAALKETKIKGQELNLIAVTRGPGLMGSLIVGVQTAKALSQVWDVPLIGVNHLEGHLFAPLAEAEDLEPPFLSLIVSGGHTEIIKVQKFGDYELLGQTRDDAAGEAYDKAARILGLKYPGGPEIDRLAKLGNAHAFNFPVPLKNTDKIEFSFSGLKTALL